MAIADKRVKISRDKFRSSLPQIQLSRCRVEQQNAAELRRLIIDGNPALIGAVLPKVEIGGLTPLKLMASANGKIAVGLLTGTLKSANAIIDYGFTRGECEVDEVIFTPEDSNIFDQITRLPPRKAGGNRLLRKLTNFISRILWKVFRKSGRSEN